MAYDDIKDKGFDNRTTDELLDIASKAGKASGESRRQKKKLREQMELLLSLPMKSGDVRTQMDNIGIDESNMDNQMAMIVAVFRQAMKGDVPAFNTIRDLIGEKPVEKVEFEGKVNNPFEGLTTEELKKLIQDG